MNNRKTAFIITLLIGLQSVLVYLHSGEEPIIEIQPISILLMIAVFFGGQIFIITVFMREIIESFRNRDKKRLKLIFLELLVAQVLFIITPLITRNFFN